MTTKVKNIAVNKTINIILRNMEKSPERCARNLIELGDHISRNEDKIRQHQLYQAFIVLCMKNDKFAVKNLFYNSFLD